MLFGQYILGTSPLASPNGFPEVPPGWGWTDQCPSVDDWAPQAPADGSGWKVLDRASGVFVDLDVLQRPTVKCDRNN